MLLVLGLLSAIASFLNASSWAAGGSTLLWSSNGFLLGVLLCAPRRHWTVYLLFGWMVNVSVGLAMGGPIFQGSYYGTCNLIEVLLAATWIHSAIASDLDLTRRRHLLALLVYGVLLAPAVTALLASCGIYGRITGPNAHAFLYWFLADALGIAVVTPLYLSFYQRKQFVGRSWPEITLHFLLLTVVTSTVFWENHYPLLFLILLPLVFLGMRLRLAGSAMGLLLVSIIGGLLTIHGHGPFMLIPDSSLSRRSFGLQFFISVALLLIYVVEVIIAESSRLQLSLQASETRFRLLAEASRDIIVLTDLQGNRRYVSPAVVELLGWQPDELIGKRYHQIVHPDDITNHDNLLEECRTGKPSNTLAYRCLRKDGSYLWMESNLRLYNDSLTGQPVGFVNVVRDISTRKAAEDELNQAFHLAESLASIDGLTGLANRRCLDETMDREWRRAMRDRTPISILMLDVDHFKRYNDLYGHLEGDACLRQVADCARTIVHRPADLLARYGGEEFVVVLPNTESAGALALAEQIRVAVANMALGHVGNSLQRVTVSIGCATQSPQRDSTSDLLFTAADQALYQAKSAGRNRIECAVEVLSL